MLYNFEYHLIIFAITNQPFSYIFVRDLLINTVQVHMCIYFTEASEWVSEKATKYLLKVQYCTNNQIIAFLSNISFGRMWLALKRVRCSKHQGASCRGSCHYQLHAQMSAHYHQLRQTPQNYHVCQALVAGCPRCFSLVVYLKIEFK